MAALYNVLNITHAVEQNFSQQKKEHPKVDCIHTKSWWVDKTDWIRKRIKINKGKNIFSKDKYVKT